MLKNNKAFMIVLLIMVGLILCSFNSKPIQIKHDEALVVKLDFKIANSAANLGNIKVSYDKSGKDVLTGLDVAISPKDPYTVIVNPPLGGWDRESYYLIVDKKVKLANNKYNTKTIVKAFQIEKAKMYTISGRISLPNKQTAPVDMGIGLQAINYNDPLLIQRQDIIMKKGQRYVDYKLTVPENKSGYYISYEVEPKEFDFVLDKGYVGQSGAVQDMESSKKMLVNKNIAVSFTLQENKEVCDAARQFIAKTIKPGMSDYEKVRVIYRELSATVRYDTGVANIFKAGEMGEYSGDKISHALLGKKAVCAGLSYSMQYLFNLIGIESDLRYAVSLSSYSSSKHVWNVVKINGKYYNMDAVTGEEGHIQSRLENRGLDNTTLFTDEMISVTRQYYDNKEYQCNSFDYASNFYNYWIENSEYKGKIVELKGKVRLAGEEKAPEGGMFAYIYATIGFETEDSRDDFENYVSVFLPEGEQEAAYKLTVPATEKPYHISAKSGRYGNEREKARYFYSQATKLDGTAEKLREVPALVLEEAKYITGQITLDTFGEKANEDIQIIVCAEEYDGSSSWGLLDNLYMEAVNIDKGSSSTTFKIAVPKHAESLLLSYEIVNANPIKEYHRIGYFNSLGTTPDYNKAEKIDIKIQKDNFILKLVPVDGK